MIFTNSRHQFLRKVLYIVVITLLLTLLLSCSKSQEDAKDTESHLSFPENVLIKMDLSNIVKRSSGTDYYLVYQNLTEDDGIEYLIVDSPEVTLEVERGSVYVIGVAEKDDYVKIIGFLGNTDLSITCIPIGEDASPILNLGKLIIKEENGEVVLEPSISTEEFVRSIGYSKDTLKLVGKADVTFKNMLNPDINRNGIVDSEEGLIWKLITSYGFFYDGIDVLDVFTYGLFKYIFMIITDYPQEKYGEGFKLGPMEGEDSDKVAILENLNNGKKYNLAGVIISGDSYQWYFNCDEEGHEDGNYKLTVFGEKTGNPYYFYFDNLKFFQPHRRFEGMIYPYVRGAAFSDGKIKEVSWKWYVKLGEETKSASKDEVYLLSDKRVGLAFVFSTEEQFHNFKSFSSINRSIQFLVSSLGVDFTENASLDLTNEDVWVFPTYEDCFAIINGRADYEMIGTTHVSFYYRYDYLPYPSDFNESSTTLKLTSENIVGRWYNLHYNSQNWSKEQLDLPYYKPAYLEFTPDGRILMDWLAFRGDEYIIDVGAYEVPDNGIVRIHTKDGELAYLYIEMHEEYMEGMIVESASPVDMDRDDQRYFIYSRY